MNAETSKLWEAVRYHLSGNGLLNAAEAFPELTHEVSQIQKFGLAPCVGASVFGDKRIGMSSTYIGETRSGLERGMSVEIFLTPLPAAIKGKITVKRLVDPDNPKAGRFLFEVDRSDLL